MKKIFLLVQLLGFMVAEGAEAGTKLVCHTTNAAKVIEIDFDIQKPLSFEASIRDLVTKQTATSVSFSTNSYYTSLGQFASSRYRAASVSCVPEIALTHENGRYSGYFHFSSEKDPKNCLFTGLGEMFSCLAKK